MLTLVDNALTILKDCVHFEGWVVLHLKNSLAMSCVIGRQAMRFNSLTRWQIHMIEKNWASTRTLPLWHVQDTKVCFNSYNTHLSPNLTWPFLFLWDIFLWQNKVLKLGKFIYWNVHDGFDWDMRFLGTFGCTWKS